MAFYIKPEDRSVLAALKRVVAEQIDKALTAIDTDPPEEAVHDLRKRCKKVRGLVRFVRPAFPLYKEENRFFRDTARIVDAYRDAKVMQDTYDILVDTYADQVDRTRLGTIRAAFTRQRTALLEGGEVADRLAQCRKRMEEGRARSRDWSLEESGFAAFSGGLAKTAKRARKAADKAFDGGDAEEHHEARKRIKYHWMHIRMLRPLWPDSIKARADLAKDLSDVLGDHHDLAVFMHRLDEGGDDFGTAEDREAIGALARQRSEDLSAKAAIMASRLFAQGEDALLDRLESLWQPWAARHGFA